MARWFSQAERLRAIEKRLLEWSPRCFWVAGRYSARGTRVSRLLRSGAYRLPTLSSFGVSRAPPCFRFHIPLIAPDVRISRIRR